MENSNDTEPLGWLEKGGHSVNEEHQKQRQEIFQHTMGNHE